MEETDLSVEKVYAERDKVLVLLAKMAQEQGIPVGIAIDEDMPDVWKYVVVINLPTGQVSWHILEEELEWFTFLDNHDMDWEDPAYEEKYKRVFKYVKELSDK